jgi:hypothetical protein
MKTDLVQKIDQSTAHRKSREQVRNYVLRHLDVLPDFLKIAFDPTHKNHVKAFWSLELVCEKKLKLFVPYVDLFCEVIPQLKDDSAIRPATKICLFLAKSNHRKNGISLTHEQEHSLIEALLDRLIQNEKVAAKVYAMRALFMLGKKYNWVHGELKNIIEHDYTNHSAAYQAATRNLLKKLNS